MAMFDPPASQAEALFDAEAALHGILTTGGVRTVQYSDGRKVEYGPQSIKELRAYIASLRGGRVSTIRLSTSKGV